MFWADLFDGSLTVLLIAFAICDRCYAISNFLNGGLLVEESRVLVPALQP